MCMDGNLEISEEYLDEVISFQGKKLCGKLMKRFEIIDDKEALKKCSKELVYEAFRDLKDILVAHNYGFKLKSFEFNTQNTETNK